MIEFSNGHRFDIGAASGALGYTGDGWWWEQPLRWLGFIIPHNLTVITKTLTYLPRRGNLDMLRPWRSVRLLPRAVVNCVGLTNPGYKWWLGRPLKRVRKAGYKVIVSLAPDTPEEAKEMVHDFNCIKEIVGIEYNSHCPNLEKKEVSNEIIEVLAGGNHPLIIKTNSIKLCKEWDDGRIAAFDLINSVSWDKIHPDKQSPLSKYGYSGSVSGPEIIPYARETLLSATNARIRTPIISGGGIYSLEELLIREEMGAKGFTLGTLFLRNPLKPQLIVSTYKRKKRLDLR